MGKILLPKPRSTQSEHLWMLRTARETDTASVIVLFDRLAQMRFGVLQFLSRRDSGMDRSICA